MWVVQRITHLYPWHLAEAPQIQMKTFFKCSIQLFYPLKLRAPCKCVAKPGGQNNVQRRKIDFIKLQERKTIGVTVVKWISEAWSSVLGELSLEWILWISLHLIVKLDKWGSISCRRRYWSRILASRILHDKKKVYVFQNNTFFIRDMFTSDFSTSDFKASLSHKLNLKYDLKWVKESGSGFS